MFEPQGLAQTFLLRKVCGGRCCSISESGKPWKTPSEASRKPKQFLKLASGVSAPPMSQQCLAQPGAHLSMPRTCPQRAASPSWKAEGQESLTSTSKVSQNRKKDREAQNYRNRNF